MSEKQTQEPDDENEENSSGKGQFSLVPYEIEHLGWNWGGFLLGPIWAFAHKLPASTILLSLFFGPIMIFVLGAKGNVWAWQYQRWENIAHFRYIQKKWKQWGFFYWGVLMFLVILVIFLPSK